MVREKKKSPFFNTTHYPYIQPIIIIKKKKQVTEIQKSTQIIFMSFGFDLKFIKLILG